MSIAADTQKALRSFRSLMCFAAPRGFYIKVLQTLTGSDTCFYRHVGPKGPKNIT